ncbi:MAG: hypothetical protein JXQ29_10045 [Planctomycetes bacterium]|nr:hypothetical protein [Planctomycetota bacterium]
MAAARRSLGHLALLALVAVLAAGCRAVEIDLYPLLRTGPVDDCGGWAWEALGPLVYFHEDHPDGKAPCREWGIRPLFSHRFQTGSARRETEVVWPLGRFRRDPSGWEDRILPLYWHWGHTTSGVEESSFFLLPVFFRRTGVLGTSWALFPLYGRVERFLGMDAVSFVLFPLYASHRRDQSTSHHVVWPIFGWGSGPQHGWYRIFPWITRSWAEGDHDSQTYLWPIVNISHDLGRTGRPRSSVLIWPFYGSWTRAQAAGWTVLFPLLRAEEDRQKSSGERNLPWPFYQAWWSPREEGWRIWPLYGRYASRPSASGSSQQSQFLLWPFLWRRAYQYLDERHEEFRVVPVFHHGTWTDRHGGGTRWMVFPLADGERRAEGSGKFAIGTLFPIRPWNDAVQAHWSVFLSPYLHRWWADGRARAQTILGLYRRYEAPGFVRWTVPLLYAHRASRRGSLDQFLLGAIRWEVAPTGAARLRILGVPIPFGRGPAPDPPVLAEDG